MKRIHWIIVAGVVALGVTHGLLKLTEPPKEPTQEELRQQYDTHVREMATSLETYLGCSVPAERSCHISQRHLPRPSVWLHISADTNELRVMRNEIDTDGWAYAPPSVPIPVPTDETREWNPPSSNVWTRQQPQGNTVRIWIAADSEQKMYYCEFERASDKEKPNMPSHRTVESRADAPSNGR